MLRPGGLGGKTRALWYSWGMDLHRADTTPEWQATPSARWSIFQRIAKSTRGIVTPGNVLTVAGLMVAVTGLVMIRNRQYLAGFVCLAVGRLFDLLDGVAAAATGTKSPLGELLDAGVDKLITLLTLVVLGTCNIVSWYLLGAILVIQGAISLVSWLTTRRGKRLHPSRVGKVSMASVWVALSGLILARALHDNPIQVASYAVGICSIGLGLWALVAYSREYTAK